MSEDIHAEALDQYLQNARYIWDQIFGPAVKAELDGLRRRYSYTFGSISVATDAPSGEARPGAELMQAMAEAELRGQAEAQDRREWIESVRRRLGLVAEVHRCRVWKRGEGDWARRCLRPGCPAGRPLGYAPSQEYALGDALAHAGAFLPLPVYEEPVAELDWAGYVPLLDLIPWRQPGSR